MNGRNRHVQYRRSVYRRKQIRTALFAAILLLALLFVVFLIVGNALHRRAESEETDTDSPSGETLPQGSNGIAAVPSIKAYPVLLETAEAGNFTSRVNARLHQGHSAVSIPLNNLSGELLYRSPTASALELQGESAYSVTIGNALASVRELNAYLSGTFYLTAVAEQDDLLRSVRLAESRALVAEALRAGLNDVLLICPVLPTEQIPELSRFLTELRALVPNARVGLALPSSFFSAANAMSALHSLHEEFDFLALNATVTGEAEPTAVIGELIGLHLYDLLRYDMRLLLPSAEDDTERAAYAAVAEANGISNYQMLG